MIYNPKFIISRFSLLCVFISSFLFEAGAQFKNDICVPSTLYMLEGIQNDIFVQPFMKRWRPYNDVARFSGSVDYSRRLQRVASIVSPVDSAIVKIDLVNQDEFATIKSVSSEVIFAKPGVGEGEVAVSIIGDSFTNGAFFINALLEKNYIPGIKMIGLREVKGHPGQFDEGRGGWTLGRYFSVTNERDTPYNGFWQPEGKFRYWGSTAFWQLVIQYHASPNEDWPFGQRYNVERFGACSKQFDTKTGFRSTPQKFDVMYDNDMEQYVVYNGKKWEQTGYEKFEWSFNYSKYLDMWELEKPQILAEFLGLNDFRNANPNSIDFTSWNEKMEIVVSSYLEAVPDGKFVLMIPSSSCGILDNKAGDFTNKQNASMWEVRKNIVDTFDGRNDEQIYIVDAAIAIDNWYGTRYLTDSIYTMPFAEYVGDERLAVQTGNPHPYTNYPTMGISLAAFIQKYRKDIKNGE